MRIGLFGFEPAIGHSLETLLRGEPGVQLVRFPQRWKPGEEVGTGVPDVMVAVPPSPEWAHAFHAALPETRLLLMVEWHAREQFQDGPAAGVFDRFQGYEGLLNLLLQNKKEPPAFGGGLLATPGPLG
jgi:hypothetical protein